MVVAVSIPHALLDTVSAALPLQVHAVLVKAAGTDKERVDMLTERLAQDKSNCGSIAVIVVSAGVFAQPLKKI